MLTLFFAALGTTLFIPFNRPRIVPSRLMCSSNLRQIGLAIKMYANEHDGLFPTSLGVVLATQEITSDVFLCPSSETETRATIENSPGPAATTRQQNAFQARLGRMIDDPAGHHCSYLYAGAGLNDNTVDADAVIALEQITDHDHDGMNFLYADGHVDWSALSDTGPTKADYERFMADFRNGKRPLRDVAPLTTQPMP